MYGELIQLLAHSEKAVSVSNCNTKTTIHIRCYFGKSDKKYPIRVVLSLAKQDVFDITSLSNVILT